MVFIKHISLESDIYFNPIFIQYFSGPSSDFSGSRILQVQAFKRPYFLGFRFLVSKFFGVWVQGQCPDFRSTFTTKFFYNIFKELLSTT